MLQSSDTKEITPDRRRVYDLEDRTLLFFQKTIRLCKKLPQDHDIVARVIIRQMIRSAGSVGANYREANEAISRKDFKHRVKICRKEAKETHFWFQGLIETCPLFKSLFRI